MKYPLSSLNDQIMELCKEGKVIEAIKLYKESSGQGLKESKEYVEALMNGEVPNDFSRPRQTRIIGSVDEEIILLCKEGKKLEAVKLYKETSGTGLKESKDYVEKLIKDRGVEMPSSSSIGCFIATACYGDYEASEVRVLRKFRDDVLLKYRGGILFVKWYYLISPSIARELERSERMKRVVRKWILSPILYFLTQK